MIQTDPATRAWLGSDAPRVLHTLVEMYTASNGNYFYTDGDIDTVWNGNTYTADGPVIERDQITQKLGIEVGETSLTFHARPEQTVGFLPFVQAARIGQLDGATIIIRQAVFALGDYAPRVVVHLFEGQTGELNVGRFSVEAQVQSYLIQLNTQIPQARFQPQCLWTLYHGGCRVNRAQWARNVTAAAGSNRLSVRLDQGQPDSQFAGGTLAGQTGANAGVIRSIRANSGNVLDLMTQLPADVLPGDAFIIAPTCNRSMDRCKQYANLPRYRGTPYVPQPEASI